MQENWSWNCVYIESTEKSQIACMCTQYFANKADSEISER